ncbi:hypothetical protein NHQ30_005728 [Ciborinia camelliae]|nr:hypothetical protein NHQ30_005728 [Ciborinia camelliae]
MPPKGPRKQFRRGEEVLVVGDANNDAFKARALNTRKRSIKPQASIESDEVEVISDDEPSQPPRKARPDPQKSKARIRAANQEERPSASKQGSEISDGPRNVVRRPMVRPASLFRPFADEGADVYIVLAPGDYRHTYRVHSHVLMHASPWFRSLLKATLHEPSPERADRVTRATGIKYRFELIRDPNLNHSVLKRLGLTMFDPMMQLQATEAMSNGLKRQSFLSNGASHSRHSSVGMPQYDGSFDEDLSEDMAGNLDAAHHVDDAHSASGAHHLLPPNSVDGIQGKEDGIKREEDVDMQPTSTEVLPPTQKDGIKREEDVDMQPTNTEVLPPTQKDTTEQIATPPTSPTKKETESDTEHTSDQNSQVHTNVQEAPKEEKTEPLETPIKAEAGSEEQSSLQSLPIAQTSPEKQSETSINAEPHQPESASTQVPPSRKVSPEAQLPIAISTDHPAEEPKVKVEEPQQETASSVQEFSNAHVSPTKEIAVPANANSAPEEPQQATRLSSKVPSNSQASSTQQAQVSTNTKPTVEAEHQPELPPAVEEVADTPPVAKPETSAKGEPKHNASSPNLKKQSEELVHPDVLDAYHSLFLCYYGFAPTISSTDLAIAVKQSQMLVKISTLYHSLKLVKPHIIASLLSHGRNLHSSIRHDPPRFLILAFKLECAPIFKEALIHIVGQAPSWPWPTPPDRIDAPLREFVQKKIDELQAKRCEANHALFQSCLVHEGVRVSINNLNPDTFDIWVIVQMWHDWFTQQVHQCARIRRDENRSAERNMYRLMAQGGEAYLKIDEMMATLGQFRADPEVRSWGHWEKSKVEMQMNIMKQFAAKTVKDLMANDLMGDIGENGDGIVEYLTCTKVEECELPWVAVTQIDEDEIQY